MTRIKLSELKPNTGQIDGLPANPRQWTQSEIDRIAKSLKETPELFEMRPLLVYPLGKEHIILGGNLRFEGAKKNKDKDCPAIVVPPGTPVEKLKEIVIKDNGSFGEWDMDMLANEWDDLPLSDWGVNVNWDEVKLEESPMSERTEVEEDDFDEEKDEVQTRCKRGDIWQLGEHRLMCGDSTSKEDVEILMGGAKADITFSSPPYNAQENLGGNTHMRDSRYIEKDDNEDYVSLLNGYLKNSLTFSRYSFMNIQMLANNKRDVIDCLSNFKNQYADVVIWNKGHGAPAMAKNVLNSCFEYVFIFSQENDASRAISSGEDFRGTIKNVYDGPPQRENEFSEVHAATFPVHLPSFFIKNFTKKSVLDLFGGTGTTMIAAEQLGRKAYLMEIDPKYCDVIIARWEKYTGRIAEKINL